MQEQLHENEQSRGQDYPREHHAAGEASGILRHEADGEQNSYDDEPAHHHAHCQWERRRKQLRRLSGSTAREQQRKHRHQNRQHDKEAAEADVKDDGQAVQEAHGDRGRSHCIQQGDEGDGEPSGERDRLSHAACATNEPPGLAWQ